MIAFVLYFELFHYRPSSSKIGPGPEAKSWTFGKSVDLKVLDMLGLFLARHVLLVHVGPRVNGRSATVCPYASTVFTDREAWTPHNVKATIE